MCFCHENTDFCMGGADSCILSNPLWQNTLSLWAALPQSMSSSSSAKTASKTSSQTPKLCIKCRTKFMRASHFCNCCLEKWCCLQNCSIFCNMVASLESSCHIWQEYHKNTCIWHRKTHLTSLLCSDLADFIVFWIFFLVVLPTSFFFFLALCISAKSCAFGAFSSRRGPFGAVLLSKYGCWTSQNFF